MEIWNIVRLLLFAVLMINGCNGSFHFNLFEINGLSPSIITVNGTEATVGPIRDGKGIRFSRNTVDIKLDNNLFAYIANTIQNSSDLTFAVYFKIMSTNKKNLTYFPFFALSDSKMLHNYFSIGLESAQAFIRVEDKKEYTDKIDWTVNIEQWLSKSKSSTKTSLKLGDSLKLGKWVILMVRIKVDDVTVSINCKEVVNGKLKDGRVGRFSFDGKLTFSQFLLNSGKKQFVGSMFEPQLINGQKAYDWYNPCTRDNKPSRIVPEPRPEDYDDSKFKEFQEMSQQDSRKPIVSCTDEAGIKRRNNGDPWIVNRCYKYQCVAGKIQVHYQCRKCDGGYKSNETWISKVDRCLQNRCMYGQYVNEKKIECKPLACPEDEQYKPSDACCARCRGDDCTQKRQYYKSCEKKCSMGVQACKTTRKGCWCPENTALNHEETECIPTAECKCKVSDKIFLPGQSIKKSLCSNCICSHGELTCFDVC